MFGVYSAHSVWNATLRENQPCDRWIGQLPISSLPPAILEAITDTVQLCWDTYGPAVHATLNLSSSATFCSWVKRRNNQERLFHLLDLDRAAGFRRIYESLVKEDPFREGRIQASMDLSQGLIKDLHPRTRQLIYKKLHPSLFPLLADGLGFGNRELERAFSAEDLLLLWERSSSCATLSRLIFEVDRLGLMSVSQILRSPYARSSPKSVLSHPIEEQLMQVPLTSFAMHHLNCLVEKLGLTLEWGIFIEMNLELDHFRKRNCLPQNCIPWMEPTSLGWALQFFWNSKPLQPLISKFQSDYLAGRVEEKNRGGITLQDIQHLGRFLPHLQSPALDISILTSEVFPDLCFTSSLTFTHFLLLCWQSPKHGLEMDFKEFCESILKILKTARGDFGEHAYAFSEVLPLFEAHSYKVREARARGYGKEPPRNNL